MIGDVKMQTIKRRTGRSLTGDRPLFLVLCNWSVQVDNINNLHRMCHSLTNQTPTVVVYSNKKLKLAGGCGRLLHFYNF